MATAGAGGPRSSLEAMLGNAKKLTRPLGGMMRPSGSGRLAAPVEADIGAPPPPEASSVAPEAPADGPENPNSVIGAGPTALGHMFPNVAKAQMELFGKLLGEPDGGPRSRALAQSMMAFTFSTDGGAAAPQAKRRTGAEKEYREELGEAFDKLERQRLAKESLERVEETTIAWDKVAGSESQMEQLKLELEAMKNVVAYLLSEGFAKEDRSEQMQGLLTELGGAAEAAYRWWVRASEVVTYQPADNFHTPAAARLDGSDGDAAEGRPGLERARAAAERWR